MYTTRGQAIFDDRHDAGRRLAAELAEYRDRSVVVLAIPNGGVLVALEVAGALSARLDLVISRRIPMPLKPEAGLGAVADDGTIILNEEVVKRTGLSQQQIEYEASRMRAEIKQRSIVYQGEWPLVKVNGRTVILIDDGLASGFTMMAAVKSVRRRQPKEIVVAVPVASAMALKNIEKVADKVVACTTGFAPKFYVSDFYRYWHNVSDDEVLRLLRGWHERHLWRD